MNSNTGPVPIFKQEREEALVKADHQDISDEPDSKFLFTEAPSSFDDMSVSNKQKGEAKNLVAFQHLEDLGGMMIETQKELERMGKKMADY